MQLCLLSIHFFGCVSEQNIQRSWRPPSKPVKHKPDVQIGLWSKELLWFTEISEGLTSPVIPWLQPRVLTSCLWRQMMRERLKQERRVRERRGPRNGCGVRSSSEKEAERSQWGVEERGLDMKPNLTRLPKIPAPSDTINTFIVFVL